MNKKLFLFLFLGVLSVSIIVGYFLMNNRTDRCQYTLNDSSSCKIYVRFNFLKTYTISREQTIILLNYLLQEEHIDNIEYYINPEHQLIEAIIPTEYNKEAATGEYLVNKYKDIIIEYKRVTDTSNYDYID